MPWLDEMVNEWVRRVANGEEVGEAHSYVHMSEPQFERWQAARPTFVAGSDEVGAGALAGPLVVCAVLAPYTWTLEGLRDSKQLKSGGSDARLEEVAAQLYSLARRNKIYYSMVSVSSERIDEVGIRAVTRRAHHSVLEAVSSTARRAGRDVLLVADGALDLPGDEISIPKADTFVPQVMAASVLAKYARDAYMKDMARVYPQYGFEQHVGYGTEFHLAAIAQYGPCPLHRRSFSPFNKEVADEPTHRKDVGDATEVGGAAPQGQRGAAGANGGVPEQRAAPDYSDNEPHRRRRSRKSNKAAGQHPRPLK